jgi:TolA-binding protein
MEKIVRTVIQYSNTHTIGPLYTWQGVNNAILRDRMAVAINEKQDADVARKKAENDMLDLLKSLDEEEKRIRKQAAEDAQAEANKLLDSFDNDLQYMQKRIEDLTHENEILQYENQGLKSKLDTINDIPVLHMGDEFEFYPGEIKDLILLVLSESVSGTQDKTRRSDVVKDIIKNNDYQKTSDQRAEEVKKLLKSYSGMTAPIRQALEDMGFIITEDGKHYHSLIMEMTGIRSFSPRRQVISVPGRTARRS